MALCSTMEKNNHPHTQNKKLSFLTTKKVFNNLFSSKEKPNKNSASMTTSTMSTSVNGDSSATTKIDFSEIFHNNYCNNTCNNNTEKKRPLVENKENLVKVKGDKIVISLQNLHNNNYNMDHNGNYTSATNNNDITSISANNNINNNRHNINHHNDINNDNKPTLKHQSSFADKPTNNRMRKCYSNDIMEFLNRSQQQQQQQQQQQGTCMLDEWRNGSPPKLLPISGRISAEMSNGIIKPIPCRPTVNITSTGNSYKIKTTSNDFLAKRTQDEGYNSQNMSSSSAITSSSSTSSNSSNYFNDKNDETEPNLHIHSVKKIRPRPRSSTAASMSYKKLIEDSIVKINNRLSVYNQECNLQDKIVQNDSVIVDNNEQTCNLCCNSSLKKIIEEKEQDLKELRERMESNEKVIASMYELKQKDLKKQMVEEEEKWLEKLKMQQQKSFRAEQSLLIQIFQLKNENNNLNEKLLEAQNEINLINIQKEEAITTANQLKHHLEKAHWQTSKKLDEIVSLKSQLVCNNGYNENVYETIFPVDNSLVSPCPSLIIKKNKFGLKKECYEYHDNINNTSYSENSSCSEKTQKIVNQPVKLNEVISQMEDLKKQNQLQHNAWLDEKNRVIEYQKKLQSNYLEVCQENRLLQEEISRLKNQNERKHLFESIATESFC